jgi:sarcosine oxidase subunit gamma
MLLHLAGAGPAEMRHSLRDPLSRAQLPCCGRSARSGDMRLLGTGLRQWLLVSDAPPGGSFAPASSLESAFAAAVDVSSAWVRLEIVGPASRDLFAKGSSLDLDPAFFPTDACAVAPFAQMPAIIHRARDEQFHLFVGRSYALSALEWLNEAAAEFGWTPQEEHPV